MQTEWDAVAEAAEGLNRGDPGPALDLCSPEAVMQLNPARNHAGAVFYGREVLRDAWERFFFGGFAPVKVTPLDLLAGPTHLVLVLEATLTALGVPRTERYILTGISDDGGRWRELWLQPAD